ncbi:MAG: HAMP domain-containing histidine kinase [Prevotella sp.]|nr:HAMP domain-containing histidine kinase [Prevotella sp.]
MNNRKHATFPLILWALIMLLVVSCQQGPKNKKLTVEELDYNDSLVYTAMENDYNLALLVVDSLEDVHALYEAKINYYRAQIYYKMGQELSAELYYKKALSSDELYRERPAICYFAYDQLSTILTIKGDQQGALATATEGYAIAKDDETEAGQEWKAIMLHDIGYCQMQLGRIAEAEKNFTHAYNTLKRLASQTNNYSHIYSWARVSYNIMDAYTSTENFEQAEKWVVAAEEAINRMVASPDCPKRTADEYVGSLNTHKAIVLVKTGQRKEAEKIYQEFLKSDHSKTSIGLFDNSEYLQHAERWEDMARMVPKLDSLGTSWKMPKSMYYLKTYLVPFFTAYQKSGHKEKALETAQRIVDAVDSIDEYERKHNAAELAIIYETQEKEAKIAEQQADMNQLRVNISIIVLLILFIFLTIFMFHRNRAAKRLAAMNQVLKQKNKELTIANARAEESSQMKSNFIRQISHEIRTPLNILNGFTQVITEPDTELDPEEKVDIQHRIAENTDRITELVNKILEMSDASSHAVIERTDDITAMQIAMEAANDSCIYNAQHIQFGMKDDSGAGDVMLHTNRQYAVRALVQLLDNAKKFTSEGEVRLSFRQQPSAMEFIVEDSGIGVPAYQAEHIFDEFVQLDDYYDGMGLGLTVARGIVRRLGGDITLDTTYTGGARFVMTLPL